MESSQAGHEGESFRNTSVARHKSFAKGTDRPLLVWTLNNWDAFGLEKGSIVLTILQKGRVEQRKKRLSFRKQGEDENELPLNTPLTLLMISERGISKGSPDLLIRGKGGGGKPRSRRPRGFGGEEQVAANPDESCQRPANG